MRLVKLACAHLAAETGAGVVSSELPGAISKTLH
jgi:hypothetical protein